MSRLMTDEHEDIGDLITGLTAAAARARDLSLASSMLSPLEYGILDYCHRGKANTVTELSRVFHVHVSVMSRLVSKLADRKLIHRQRLPSDRRTVRLSLTNDGQALLRTLAEELRESNDLLVRGINGDEWAAFYAAAHKVLANLEDTASLLSRGAKTLPAMSLAGGEVIDERMGNG